MKPALLLIDLQNDFLNSPRLEPCAGQLLEGAHRVLEVARRAQIPVIHVWTTVNAPQHEPDTRMPHWKTAQKWSCVENTRGHETPRELRNLPHDQVPREHVVHKQFFSAFENGELDAILQSAHIDTLILIGVHLHGCIRTAALEAYARGHRVLVVRDAIGSDDALHAAITHRYLAARSVEFVSLEELKSLLSREENASQNAPTLPSAIVNGKLIESEKLNTMTHFSPRAAHETLFLVPICDARLIADATRCAKNALRDWRNTTSSTRCALLQRFMQFLSDERESFAQQMAQEIGKPIAQGRSEINRALALIETVTSFADEPLQKRCTADSSMRFRPLGVVAVITPWNNPVAIAVGKIAPALFYGNVVVWKPAPQAASISIRLMLLWQNALASLDCRNDVINLVCGDDTTARALMNGENIDAVTITGSAETGYAAQEICATRHVPLQAELGGNNAAIVWRDCDLKNAAQQIAEAAFGFAGQRCTANRRAIVDGAIYDEFVQLLENATRELVLGDSCDEATQIGPMISQRACQQSSSRSARARIAGCKIVTTHENVFDNEGAYFSPTIVLCNEANAEIVQEESFAPICVVQRARDFDHALELCNGVRHGLAAALFSTSSTRQSQFLDEAQAGIANRPLA